MKNLNTENRSFRILVLTQAASRKHLKAHPEETRHCEELEFHLSTPPIGSVPWPLGGGCLRVCLCLLQGGAPGPPRFCHSLGEKN